MRQLSRPLSLLLSLALFAASGSAQEFKPRDTLELGRAVKDWLEVANKKDDSKAMQSVRDVLVRVGKSGGVKDELKALQIALGLTAGLEQGAYQALELKNLKAEEVTKRPVPRSDPYVYAVRTPKGYKVSQGPYPVIVVLPGLKDSKPWPPDLFLSEELLEPELRETFLLVVVPMPEDTKLWHPPVSTERKDRTGIDLTMFALADLRRQYAVDYSRTYLYARDAGVETAVRVAGMFPHLFAGVIGRMGDTGEAPGDNLRNLPTLFIAGGAQASAFVEQNKKLGYNNSELRQEASAADVAAWIKEHPRQSNPAQVTLFPGAPIPFRSYWIEVPPLQGEPGTSVDAKIDRAANTVQVTAKGVDQFTLYLNDQLCDLSLPLKVTINGKEQEVLLPRSLDLYLQLLARSVCDPARVYTASHVFTVPK